MGSIEFCKASSLALVLRGPQGLKSRIVAHLLRRAPHQPNIVVAIVVDRCSHRMCLGCVRALSDGWSSFWVASLDLFSDLVYIVVIARRENQVRAGSSWIREDVSCRLHRWQKSETALNRGSRKRTFPLTMFANRNAIPQQLFFLLTVLAYLVHRLFF